MFKKGKLVAVMDAQAGSSGKGRTASAILQKYDNWTFACNAFSSNAAHWIKLEDGRKFLYKTLNSCAYDTSRYEKMYIGPGAAIEVEALLQEMEENRIPQHKLGISPMTIIVQEMDAEYEKGRCGFDGESTTHEGTMKTGSTCSGVGTATARRSMRRPNVLLAKDVPILKDMVCDVTEEISNRLDNGESGMLEIAQGFQLSLMHHRFFPHTTYRNVTTAGALSDMMLAPKYLGEVVLNFRTFPIRISNNKYIGEDGAHLTWDQVQAGVPHKVYQGYSGDWYPDQQELTWDELTQMSGSKTSLMEITSKTKLPRRVSTFSRMNLEEAIRYNDGGHGISLAINFADYVDQEMAGSRDAVTTKFQHWLNENLGPHYSKLRMIGTGPLTEDTIWL